MDEPAAHALAVRERMDGRPDGNGQQRTARAPCRSSSAGSRTEKSPVLHDVVVDDEGLLLDDRAHQGEPRRSGSSLRPGRSRRRRRGRARRAPPPGGATDCDGRHEAHSLPRAAARSSCDLVRVAWEERHGPGHARAGAGPALRVHAVGRAAQARARGRGGHARLRRAGSASPTPPRSTSGASSACSTTSTTSRTRPRTRTSTSAAGSSASAAIPRRSSRPSAPTPTT